MLAAVAIANRAQTNVAPFGRRDLPATGIPLTLVDGAGILVVAVRRNATHATAIGTGIVGGARVAIVAGQRIGGEDAPRLDSAGIIGARVAVIANQLAQPSASSICADVPRRAGIAVITGNDVGGIDASDIWFAIIIGTEILVIADHEHWTGTQTALADIVAGARITIIAGCDIMGVNAPRIGVTRIVSADVSVIAVNSLVASTLTVNT